MSEHEPQHPDIDPPQAEPAPTVPPGSTPKKDWLHTAARAAETVAPLVARQAPKAEEIPEDRRGRLTTVLAIAGILMAVLQFLAQAYDLFTRPLAPLVSALPFLAAGLLAAGGMFGLYTALRTHSRRQRRLALGSTLLVLLVALSWGGWLAYDALRPPAGYRILVSEFDGAKARDYIDFGQRIAENLRSQLADSPAPIEVRRVPTVFADPESARRAGQEQRAGIVIWGWYDDRGVSPHVEVLSLPHSTVPPSIPLVFTTANAASPGSGAPPALQPLLGKLVPVTRTPSALPSLDLFTAHGPSQMAYVAATVLGMSYLANDDLSRALALFDQALASVAGDPQTAQGQEVVHFQRAAVLYRLGRFGEARADLEKALMLAPDYVPAHLLLADILANTCTPARDLDAALAAARSAAAAEPANVLALQTLAELSLRAGDPEAALAAAEQARGLDPNQRAAYTLLAAIYAALGRDVDNRAARERALVLAQQEVNQLGLPAGEPDALYALGDAYLALDRYAEALAAYTQAQTAAPQDLRLHQAKGNVYFWQGKPQAAIAEYTAWSQAAPADPAPHMLLGLTYAGQGKSADALAQYMAAAQLSTCDPAILLLLGGAQAEAGELKAAADTYAQALAIDPQNPDVLFSAGANHLMLGDDAAAVENLAALVAVRPQMSKAHYYLGVAYEELGERDKAQSAYAEAARLAAGASPPPLDLAYAYEKLGRVDDAITVYVQLLAEHESPDLHTYLGALYADKGAGDLARAEYARALELDPEQTLARFALANLDFAAGNWQAAAGGYEALLGQEESASLHEYAAQAYLQLGDLAAAFRHQQAAAQLEPTRAELWARLALIANWLNRLGDAGYAADQALRLKPDDAAVYFTRGQIAYKRCDLSEAVANLQRATELVPDNPLYLGSLGGYYSARGDMESVAPLLAELQAGGPADYFAHWLAGDLLALRDGKAALAEYAKALQPPDLSPGVAAALHAAVGQQYLLTGNTAAAAAAYTQALAQAPDYIDAEIGLGDLAWLAGDPEGAQNHYRAAVATLPAYAAKYSYDKAAIVAPALQARLALTARARGDLRDEVAALAAAEEQLDALRAAAPQWAVVAVVEGMMALVKADSTAADDAFARAIACDKTLGDTRRRIEALVAGTE